ncbi:MAG: diacylglycerol kinase family lipid kinase [Clostridia bacterium]|nr:diacylglycerol kinase family lipid kinase [Clostridia bacterium]
MIDFIINGKAGSGKSLRAKNKLIQLLEQKNIEYKIHLTEYQKHATQIAKDLCANGATTIVAVGGDGTVNEVLNGIDLNVNFGIIPLGSGNDFVTSAKIPTDVEAALDIVLTQTAKPTDFLVCDGIRGLNVIGTGIDVEILERCSTYKLLKGKLQYFVSLVVSLFKFNFYNCKIKRDGELKDTSAMIICCCNGGEFGGGIPICPDSNVADGQMEFIYVTKMNKAKMVSYLIKLMQGKILEQEFCHRVKQDEVQVVFDNPISIQIDGEIYRGIKFDIHIEKGKLKLFRP